MSGWDRVHMTVFTKPWKTLTIPELGARCSLEG